ncbi:MAG: M67 family metallopeptidase [Pyrinomonadaceae bacterium]|nr:M67 family metallopeptidase [Pyrinomonadaceae bacterium]
MIILRNAQLTEIFAHARQATPFECCGLIGGVNDRATSIHPLRNVACNPRIAYEAAPEELFAAQKQMRERDEQLLAIYHSHPRSTEPVPSETDVRLAYYPAAIYLIIGLGGANPIMRGFRISERGKTWQQVEYAVADE